MCLNFTSNVLGICQKLCSKVQKYYLRNPQTSLKKARNNPEKLRENTKSAASLGIELRDHGTGNRQDNHYTMYGLKLCRQKDNISVDSRSRVNKKSF